MLQRVFILLFFLFSVLHIEAWNSKLVSVLPDGTLAYHPDDDGFVLPDFSYAGYEGGSVALPEVAVAKTLAPISGDNTSRIQNALDEIAKLPLSEDGFRGALLLEAGEYSISGTLYVRADGIVLRGSGKNETILKAIGDTPHQRDVLILGNSSQQVNGTKEITNTRQLILDDVISVGSFSFTLSDASKFKTGDCITLYHPATATWLEAVDYGGVPYPDPSSPTDADERWTVGKQPIVYLRKIVKIEGNKVFVNAPIFYTLEKRLSETYVYKPDMSGQVKHVGIEKIGIEIDSNGGTDENHAWQAVRFKSCEQVWALDCMFKGFGQSGIITEACIQGTFRNCDAIDPVAIITGERMYNFNTYVYSQLNLFDHCYASNGRHHYVSNGTSTASGNVFLRCVSEGANSVNEGHRQWTQGMLFDNHRETNLKRDFVLGLYNRVAMGTGHGWAAVQSVLWNCDVNSSSGKIGLQKPPTSQNYAIGCMAKTITGNPVNASNFERGYVEGQNESGLFPESLYEAQLANRIQNHTQNRNLNEVSGYVVRVEKDAIVIRSKVNLDDCKFYLYSMNGFLLTSNPIRLNDREAVFANLMNGGYCLVVIGRKISSFKEIIQS